MLRVTWKAARNENPWAEAVLVDLPHVELLFAVPKMLRRGFLFDRSRPNLERE